MEGYLDKYTNVIHGFRSRYFKLQDGYLYYAKTKSELPLLCRGSICVAKAVIKTKSKPHASNSSHSNVLTISLGKKKSLILKAKEVPSYQQWVDALFNAQKSTGKPFLSLTTPNSSASFQDESSSDDSPRPEPPLKADNLRSLIVSLQNQLFELQTNKVEFFSSLNALFEIDGTKLVEVTDGKNSAAVLAKEMYKTEQSFKELAMQCISFISSGAAIENDYSHLLRVSNEASISNVACAKLVANMHERNMQRSTNSEDDSFQLPREHQQRRDTVTSSTPSSPIWPMRPSIVVDDYSKLRNRFAKRASLRAGSRQGSCAENIFAFISSQATTINTNRKDQPRFSLNLPIGCYEPLSVLQRMVEQLQCTYLLDRVALAERDPVAQLAHLSSFVVSMSCMIAGRVSSPFQPIEGETFEFCWETESESRVWVLCESIVHDQGVPVSLMFCESDCFGWKLSCETVLQYTMQPHKLNIINNSLFRLNLKDGSQFSWNMPGAQVSTNAATTSRVQEQLWLNQTGTVEISSNKDPLKASINFQKHSYFSLNKRPPNFTSVTIYDESNSPKLVLQGQWNKFLESDPEFLMESGSGIEPRRYWDIQEIAGSSSNINYDIYNFSNFTLALNDFINSAFESNLPVTDSRFRSDLRALESTDFANDFVFIPARSKDKSENLQPKYFSATTEKGLQIYDGANYTQLPQFQFTGAYQKYQFKKSSLNNSVFE